MKTINKKGALFTVLAVLLATLFYFLLAPATTVPFDKRVEAEALRIDFVEDYVSNINPYFQTTMSIAGIRALETLSDLSAEQGVMNATELQCNFERLTTSGIIMNSVPVTFYTGDLWFNLSNITNNTVGGSTYAQLPVMQNFTVRKSGVLTNASFKFRYMSGMGDTRAIQATLYVFNQRCNSLGSLIDYGIINKSFPDSILAPEVNFAFENKYMVTKGETLYFIIDADYTGADFLALKTVNALPEGNVSTVSLTTYEHPLLENSSFADYAVLLGDFSQSNLSVSTAYRVDALTLQEHTPWSVMTILNYTYFVKDTFATWEHSDSIAVEMPLEGLSDPLYSLYQQNKTIKQSSYLGIWNVAGNITAFKNLYINQTYITNNRSPSYLMRLANDTGVSSCCGIESLADGPFVENRSYVDYLFLSDAFFNCSANELYKSADAALQNLTLDRYSVAYYDLNSSFSLYGC
ncbi:hypothetical protein C4573_02005 [Candidatus Woesearchaeota archaeon]|nr:MAG: hypothetical protein C4573_02005 [Candidatus Woesearchaeota archaeon]